MIIRSHEGPDSIACQKGLKNMLEGYSTDHEVESGKLHTLFSAPDYPQVYISFCTSLFFHVSSFLGEISNLLRASRLLRPSDHIIPFYQILM